MHTTGRYNILIVDDEPLFRLALRNLLSTGGFNVRVIGEASDGEEALLYKDHNPMPDLIFVDMKMPRMNGVEFIRRWKEDSGTGIGNQAIFIALSSYQDYAFVREAFLLGALDYIVKVDMTPSYLLPVVEKALAELDKRKLEPWIDMNNKINGKQALFKKMLQPDSDEEAVRKQLAELGIVLSEKERGLAVILTDREQPENGREAGSEVIRSVLEQVLQAKGLQAEIVIVQPDEHVLLLYQTQVSSYMYFWNRSHELFSVVQRRLSRYANLTVTIGVSTIGMKPWKSLYREAVEAASLRFFCGGGRLFLPDSRKAWEYEQAKQLLKESETDAEARALLETLGNPDRSLWENRFQAWSQRGIPAAEEEQVRKLFSDFVWKLGAVLLARDCKWEQLQEPYRHPFQLLDQCRTLAQLWEQLKGLIEAVHLKLHESPVQGKSLLQQAKTYIDRHYGEGITLTLLAHWVGVSESHLSKMFVKEAGEKFIDYLTRIRIQKAKELMGTGMKLYEISERVGYPNPEHFSRVFKKEAGLSPAQYRDRMESQK